MSDLIKKPIQKNPLTVYVGSAAEDIASDSIILKIICPELIPNSSFGSVGAGISQATIMLKDRDGNAVSSSVTTANHLVATWQGESNQRYPPMVRKGEPVEVYQVANQDKYYWRTTGRGRDFRTVDRLHFEVGATDPTKPGVAKDDTNTYSASLDSANKKVSLKTSKANGEAVAFSIEADTDAGTFHLSDDTATSDGSNPGTRLFIDTGIKSGTPVFQVNLSSGATFKLEGDNAFIKIPGSLQMDISKRFIINSPIIVFGLTQTGSFIINAANIAINAAKDTIITAGGVFGVNATASKFGGVLVAAAIRSANVVKGISGSLYKPVTIQRPQETPVVPPNNTADTDMTGLPYRN